MPKKSRRSRVKRTVRNSRKPIAVKEANHPPQVLPISAAKQAVAKSTVTPAEQPVRYPYVLSELRRTAVIAGGILVLLIVLRLIFG